MKSMRTCVQPNGQFIFGIHKPHYSVRNFRVDTQISPLGVTRDTGTIVTNQRNFPAGDVNIDHADWIFEIPNPFPFKGTTYIDKEWADASAAQPQRIRIPAAARFSLSAILRDNAVSPDLIKKLPSQLQLALAVTSHDGEELGILAEICCDFVHGETGRPVGLKYRDTGKGNVRATIHDLILFEAIANNPFLPDDYKIAMVIRPGAQGNSEIVGEWPQDGTTHVYEYLRRNSYIAGGHYAANMAEDAIRYSIDSLAKPDIFALRHLYYQRIFSILADQLQIACPAHDRIMTSDELESLRVQVRNSIHRLSPSAASLWGWNFGFDYAPSGYRLHASHQQIHQQYALVPGQVEAYSGTSSLGTAMQAFGCGDMIAETMSEYAEAYSSDFFSDYRNCILKNQRMDGDRNRPQSLVIWQDSNVMLFVPKAQTSQWEVQIMTLPNQQGQLPGNILECSQETRHSLDTALLYAQKALAALGAQMVTSIEYPKRFGSTADQALLYALLPRLPESPGAFSEAQLRFINGHYPEDFAAVCRDQLQQLNLR